MRIAVDIDEVIVDTTNTLISWYNSTHKTKLTLSDFKKYYIEEALGVSREQGKKLFDKFLHSLEPFNPPPIKGAIPSIRELAQKNEITLLTARPEEYRNQTSAWFEYYLEEYKDKVIYAFSPSANYKTKAEICLDSKIKLIIEDNPEYAFQCAQEGIEVILLSYPWNNGLVHERISRVANWEEAVQTLNQIPFVE